MRDNTRDDNELDGPKENSVPEQPAKEEDGQATDDFDRAQPELTEQNLLSELAGAYAKQPDPAQRERVEEELEEMSDDISDANRK